MQMLKLDLNDPQFQKDLLQLQQIEQLAILRTLKKLSQMTWQQVYQDSGLKWEALSKFVDPEKRVYSFRFSQKYRGTALRHGDYLCVLGLHPDHDGAYR